MRSIATSAAAVQPMGFQDYRSELLTTHRRDTATMTLAHRRAAAGILLRFSRDYDHTGGTVTVTVPRHDVAVHVIQEIRELTDATGELVSCTGAHVALRIPFDAAAARILGITGRGDTAIRGLPPSIVAGNDTGLAVVWRAALLTAGYLDAAAANLELACPGPEATLAMAGAARRLGAGTLRSRDPHPRRTGSRYRVQTRDITAIARVLTVTGASLAAQRFAETAIAHKSLRRSTPTGGATLVEHNISSAAAASAEAITRAQRALEILGDDVPAALAQAAALRIAHPHIGLRALVELTEPTLTKDTLAGRLRRLFVLADRAAAKRGIPDTLDAAAAARPVPRHSQRG